VVSKLAGRKEKTTGVLTRGLNDAVCILFYLHFSLSYFLRADISWQVLLQLHLHSPALRDYVDLESSLFHESAWHILTHFLPSIEFWREFHQHGCPLSGAGYLFIDAFLSS
jgi:hypothetical protein